MILPDNSIRRVGPVMILLHHAGAGTGNFSNLIDAKLVPVIIDNLDIETHDGRADGRGLCALLMRPVHGPKPFRIAIQLVQIGGDAPDDVGFRIGTKRGSRTKNRFKAAQIGGIHCRIRQGLNKLGRDHEGVGDFLILNGL